MLTKSTIESEEILQLSELRPRRDSISVIFTRKLAKAVVELHKVNMDLCKDKRSVCARFWSK